MMRVLQFISPVPALGAACVLLLLLSSCRREETGPDGEHRTDPRAGYPDQFAEYHTFIRTTEGESGPGYPQNYQVEELSRAKRAAKSSGRPLPWVERGPGNVGGRTRAIVVDPDDPRHDTWYAASVSGGIWKTTTEGRSWTNTTPDIPNLAFSTLVQAASDPNVLYAGSGEGFFNGDAVSGAGIFRSSDRGNSWVQLPSTATDSNFRFVNRLVVSPSDPDLVVAATRKGIFRSSDGGASWSQSHISILSAGVYQVVADPSNFDRLYATENGTGVLRSMDAGRTWEPASAGFAGLRDGTLSSGSRIELAIAPSEPTRLYAAIEVANDSDDATTDTDQLYMSRNGGDLWFPIHPIEGGSNPDWMALGGTNQGWYDNSIAVHPFDPNVVFLGGIYVWRATLSGSEERSVLTSFEKFGTEAFMDFINFGASHFGGTLSWGLAEEGALVTENDFVSVEVRFGPGRSQMAHRFTPPDGPGIAFSTYPYADYVEVPFEVWDVTNNRQLIVSFRD
ncbi:MAG: hypothetical protein IIA50_06105, partial [Bacteroidetes bacterium]|nr:hypothetical protein [Bacteroidota bacterium]